MKKIIISIAVIAMLFAGCEKANDNSDASSELKESISTTETVKSDELQTSSNDTDDLKTTEIAEATKVTEATIPVEEDIFTSFENQLTAKGYAYEKITMAAELIGASSGAKYTIGDSRIELYEFDMSCEAYITAEQNQKIHLDGYGDFDATVKNGYAITVEGGISEEALDIFNSAVGN